MKHVVIQYRREHATPEQWHQEVTRFITALDSDPAIGGKISYRCMSSGEGPNYVHLVEVRDDAAQKTLQERDYFKHYTAETRRISGGSVQVTPMHIVAETKRPA
jgi:quinol monooxygenase YgiN